MAKAKGKKIIFRGAEFREVDMRMGEGQAFVRIKVCCDITPALATAFGWEIYQNGHLASGLIGTTNLEGEELLEELSLQPNGSRSDPFECKAVSAEDFKLTRKKADDGDGLETQLRFTIVSLAWKEVAEYFGMLGTADGVLKLTTQATKEDIQPTLAEQPELQTEAAEEPEPEEPAAKSKTGSIASRLKMERTN